MPTIDYIRSIVSEEVAQLEINDLANCFLKGYTESGNLIALGVWSNENVLKTVKLTRPRIDINEFEYNINKLVKTIQDFCKVAQNSKIDVIQPVEFFDLAAEIVNENLILPEKFIDKSEK